ncbi:MAG: hypothetical protein IPK07_15440 [Deltaproteobacteria bacterium]|nr:hypothetical protein [Deltaproteobacteria bacterium]
MKRALRASRAACRVLGLIVAIASVAHADEAPPSREEVETLERRVDELEREVATTRSAGHPSTAPTTSSTAGDVWSELTRRVRLGGNADVGLLYGEEYSRAPDGRFVIDNARLFVDADLVTRDDLPLEGWLDDVSFFLEWDLYRHTAFMNEIQSLYVRFDHLFAWEPLNLKVGRMEIPFGYEYTRWSEDRPSNPLPGFSAAQPYGWDEGLEVFGSAWDGLVSYQLALLDGDQQVGVNSQSTPSLAGKLTVSPAPWAHLSASGYTSGKLGQLDHPVWSALIIASAPFPPLSTNPYNPEYPGQSRPEDDPARLDGVGAWEVDVVLERAGVGTAWLGYGQVRADGSGEPITGRTLRYGVGEGTLELGSLAAALDRLYLAARISFIRPFDDRAGYLLNVDDDGFELGFDTELVTITELGLGLRITRHLTLKGSYSMYDFGVVDGADAETRHDATSRDYGWLVLSAGF